MASFSALLISLLSLLTFTNHQFGADNYDFIIRNDSVCDATVTVNEGEMKFDLDSGAEKKFSLSSSTTELLIDYCGNLGKHTMDPGGIVFESFLKDDDSLVNKYRYGFRINTTPNYTTYKRKFSFSLTNEIPGYRKEIWVNGNRYYLEPKFDGKNRTDFVIESYFLPAIYDLDEEIQFTARDGQGFIWDADRDRGYGYKWFRL